MVLHKLQGIEFYGSKTKTIQPNILPQRSDKMCLKKYHFTLLCALCQIEMMITALLFEKACKYVEYLTQELSRILFYWVNFFRSLSASHVKCYQIIVQVNSN